jgi:hypothetical protein
MAKEIAFVTLNIQLSHEKPFTRQPCPSFALYERSFFLFLASSAEQLRPKSGKTMQTSAWQGIAMFCMQGLKTKGSPGQKYCSPGFA